MAPRSVTPQAQVGGLARPAGRQDAPSGPASRTQRPGAGVGLAVEVVGRRQHVEHQPARPPVTPGLAGPRARRGCAGRASRSTSVTRSWRGSASRQRSGSSTGRRRALTSPTRSMSNTNCHSAGLDVGGEAPQLLDQQPASIAPEDVGLVHPVAHVALVADRVEQGIGAAGAAGAGSARRSSHWMALRLGSPARTRRCRSNRSGRTLPASSASTSRMSRPGRRHQHGGVAAVDAHLGRAGGMAESEAAVDDRLGRDQAGEGLASRPGVVEHARHQLAQQAPPAVGRDGRRRRSRRRTGSPGRRRRAGREASGPGWRWRRWPRSGPGPRPPRPGRPPARGRAAGRRSRSSGIVGRRVEERHPHRGHERRLLARPQPAYFAHP